MTHDYIEAIRTIVCNILEAQKLANVIKGTVISTNPYKVYIDQRLTLPEGALIIPNHFKVPYETQTEEEYPKKVIIDNTLKNGDKVAMIRNNGGQRYLIVGVID